MGKAQSRLHFALGKILDDCGDYDQAYAHYQQANQKQRELRPYDSERIRTYARHILKVFDRPLVERLSAWGHPSEQPVFIVGLPRSGTSLVEQIIASHPRCFWSRGTASSARAVAAQQTADRNALSSGGHPTWVRAYGQPGDSVSGFVDLGLRSTISKGQ